MLFPIRLMDFERLQQCECFDADIGNDLARAIRKIYVPDFSNWKNHDSTKRNSKSPKTPQARIPFSMGEGKCTSSGLYSSTSY